MTLIDLVSIPLSKCSYRCQISLEIIQGKVTKYSVGNLFGTNRFVRFDFFRDTIRFIRANKHMTVESTLSMGI